MRNEGLNFRQLGWRRMYLWRSIICVVSGSSGVVALDYSRIQPTFVYPQHRMTVRAINCRHGQYGIMNAASDSECVPSRVVDSYFGRGIHEILKKMSRRRVFGSLSRRAGSSR